MADLFIFGFMCWSRGAACYVRSLAFLLAFIISILMERVEQKLRKEKKKSRELFAQIRKGRKKYESVMKDVATLKAKVFF